VSYDDIFDTEPVRRLPRPPISLLNDVRRYVDRYYEPDEWQLEDEFFECSSIDGDFCLGNISSADAFGDEGSFACSKSVAPPRAMARRELWDDRIPHRPSSIEDMLEGIGKSFSETLLEYIDMKGMRDQDAYKCANVDRRTFSKIRCDREYKPSKLTAFSFVIGLRLSIEEANHLLATAGMCFSPSSRLDLIVEYFVLTGKYEGIDEVNSALYHLGESVLGHVYKDDTFANH
jgi:hypothetical protein